MANAAKKPRRRNQTPVDGLPWAPVVFNDATLEGLPQMTVDKWQGLTDEDIKKVCNDG